MKEKKDRNKFIYISNYFKEKGIIELLESFSDLITKGYDIELDTYGLFSSSSLKNEILKYNSDKIRIHGTISGDQKYLQIRKSTCLIVPSWNEGQPLVILEAMANATPVIATNVGLIPEMLGENYEFMYSPKNRAELKDRIIAFLSRQHLNEPGDMLFKRYQQYFSKSKHKKKVLEIFKLNEGEK
ncbi:glycosyltransferase family 4 protein [Bacteroidota bacterium]